MPYASSSAAGKLLLQQRYLSFREWLRHQISRTSDVNRAILLASFYGEVKHSNFDGIYFDPEVEDRVHELYTQECIRPLPTRSGAKVLLLASDLLDYGGHTEVVLKWLAWKPGRRTHELLVTRSLTNKVRERLAREGTEVCVCTDYSSAAIDLILERASDADTIVLHIHPDDIVAAVAARILRDAGRKVIFYNHADHCFSFAIQNASVVAELSSFGEMVSRRSGRVAGDACWLGIPIDSAPIELQPETRTAPTDRTVLTCGSPAKFRPDGELDFGAFVDLLLEADQVVRVVLVGPSGAEEWWAEARARWGDRVQFRGHMPRTDFLQELRGASVYVDSFPMTGGTAFTEAVLSGALCTGVWTHMNGYNPADVLRVPDLNALVQRVKRLLDRDSDLLAQIELVREQVVSTLGRDAFVARVERIYRGDYVACVNPLETSAAGDPQWCEQNWLATGSLNLPTGGTFRKLPYAFRLLLLAKLLPAARHLGLATITSIVTAGMKRRALLLLNVLKPAS